MFLESSNTTLRHLLLLLLLLLLPDPFRGMGAWQKTMEPQKPGNFPGPGPEVDKISRVAKERAAQRVSSWTVQNEMKGVLRRVSTAAARRILDSANPGGCIRCSEDERTQQP